MLKEKLIQKLSKKGKELDPLEKSAKVGVIKSLSLQAGSMMGDKMKGLKKPDASIEAVEEAAHEDLDNDNEEGESPEHKAKVFGLEDPSEEPVDIAAEHADCSPEELDEKIQALQDLKAQKELHK